MTHTGPIPDKGRIEIPQCSGPPPGAILFGAGPAAPKPIQNNSGLPQGLAGPPIAG